MARKFLVSRIALAVALSSGLAVAVAPPALAAKKEKPPKAPVANFSEPFRKAAVPIEKAMTEATSKFPKPTAADMPTMKAQIDAALGGNGKAAFDAAIPTATTPDDKQALGSMMRNFGIISQDLAFKQRGNVLMLESGKLSADVLGSTNYDTGVTAWQLKDYATAAKYLKVAKDAGFRDAAGQLDLILADSYKRSGNTDAVLQLAKDDIAAAQAKGVAPSETSLRNALQEAYSAKKLAPSAELAALLGRYYPKTWSVGIGVVGQLAALPRDQDIDLMRLKYLTNAMDEKRDYFLYLEDVDPRAYPGEALKIINDGLAKGKLTQAEIGADKANTSSRVGADKASLPATERDAMKAGATAATVTGAGDVFLSYDDPAKAETLYTKALGMPGADAAKVALRLGMSQALQGKYADAQTNFAKVTGTRAPVAKLWAAYAASKAAPAPAAAPAS